MAGRTGQTRKIAVGVVVAFYRRSNSIWPNQSTASMHLQRGSIAAFPLIVTSSMHRKTHSNSNKDPEGLRRCPQEKRICKIRIFLPLTRAVHQCNRRDSKPSPLPVIDEVPFHKSTKDCASTLPKLPPNNHPTRPTKSTAHQVYCKSPQRVRHQCTIE